VKQYPKDKEWRRVSVTSALAAKLKARIDREGLSPDDRLPAGRRSRIGRFRATFVRDTPGVSRTRVADRPVAQAHHAARSAEQPRSPVTYLTGSRQ
jgi:hypothetical protein